MINQLAHSPLGASGAERWMNCAGSVALLNALEMPETDEADYQIEGTAAHEAGALALTENLESWELVGRMFNGVECSEEMATAVQTYLDVCRCELLACDVNPLVEHHISAPDFHRNFSGTVDFAFWDDAQDLLHVYDYKHGVGVMVEVEHNPQIMYYAYGLLRQKPDFHGQVMLRIVQPRGFHPDGPVRSWLAYADDIRQWAIDVLKPAMDATEIDRGLCAGDWCRFCPAKLVCPLMHGLFEAATIHGQHAQENEHITIDAGRLDREYALIAPVKFYIKALEAEIFRRLQQGKTFTSAKLVNQRANRVFKPGAAELFSSKYGDKAFSRPELLSPAQMALIDAHAKELVKEWAFTPTTGMTVAPMSDKRPAIKASSLKETFAGVINDETNHVT